MELHAVLIVVPQSLFRPLLSKILHIAYIYNLDKTAGDVVDRVCVFIANENALHTQAPKEPWSNMPLVLDITNELGFAVIVRLLVEFFKGIVIEAKCNSAFVGCGTEEKM
jgi:hypothetical protein